MNNVLRRDIIKQVTCDHTKTWYTIEVYLNGQYMGNHSYETPRQYRLWLRNILRITKFSNTNFNFEKSRYTVVDLPSLDPVRMNLSRIKFPTDTTNLWTLTVLVPLRDGTLYKLLRKRPAQLSDQLAFLVEEGFQKVDLYVNGELETVELDDASIIARILANS